MISCFQFRGHPTWLSFQTRKFIDGNSDLIVPRKINAYFQSIRMYISETVWHVDPSCSFETKTTRQSLKGALCSGQIYVPTEYVCYCFDELSDPNAFHLSVFTWHLSLYNHLFICHKTERGNEVWPIAPCWFNQQGAFGHAAVTIKSQHSAPLMLSKILF